MSADIFEKINKKVRTGQVSLFVHAGFSLKAGAPSAKNLVNCMSRLFPKGSVHTDSCSVWNSKEQAMLRKELKLSSVGRDVGKSFMY